MSASPCVPRARPGPLRVRSPAGRGHAPGAPGSLLPTALGDPGDKRVAGASPRVARGRRERAGLGGARPSSSFSRLAFASPGLSRASRRAGPEGRDRSRGGGARRWPAVARYARSRRRCLIFLRRETCSAPPPRPAPRKPRPLETTPPPSESHLPQDAAAAPRPDAMHGSLLCLLRRH